MDDEIEVRPVLVYQALGYQNLPLTGPRIINQALIWQA